MFRNHIQYKFNHNVNTENDAWGKPLYDKLHPQSFIDQFIGRHTKQQSTDVFTLFSCTLQ